MNPSPPTLNLLVIRSADIQAAANFYRALGLDFVLEAHGKGPKHYAANTHGVVFEIYPQNPKASPTTSVRLGFQVTSIQDTVQALANLGAKVLKPPHTSPWGTRAVLKDPDGHTVELLQAQN